MLPALSARRYKRFIGSLFVVRSELLSHDDGLRHASIALGEQIGHIFDVLFVVFEEGFKRGGSSAFKFVPQSYGVHSGEARCRGGSRDSHLSLNAFKSPFISQASQEVAEIDVKLRHGHFRERTSQEREIETGSEKSDDNSRFRKNFREGVKVFALNELVHRPSVEKTYDSQVIRVHASVGLDI